MPTEGRQYCLGEENDFVLVMVRLAEVLPHSKSILKRRGRTQVGIGLTIVPWAVARIRQASRPVSKL